MCRNSNNCEMLILCRLSMSVQTWIHSRVRMSLYVQSQLNGHPGFRRQVKVKWSHYRPGVAQRVDRGITLFFHDRGTRRGWVVSSTPRSHFTPGKDPVPIVLEAGWAPGPVWTGGKSRPHRDSIPDRPQPIVTRYTNWATWPTFVDKYECKMWRG